jgi:primosomal protein N' (replication factor Y)
VLLQTHYPGHPLLQDVIQNGYSSFARSALLERQQTRLPPYQHLALFRTESFDSNDGLLFLTGMQQLIATECPQVQYLGPLKPPLERKAGKFRWQLQLFCRDRRQLHLALDLVLSQCCSTTLSRKIKWQLDVDALDLN